jgi:hypothetical protein
MFIQNYQKVILIIYNLAYDCEVHVINLKLLLILQHVNYQIGITMHLDHKLNIINIYLLIINIILSLIYNIHSHIKIACLLSA